jgi:hypothetical protein
MVLSVLAGMAGSLRAQDKHAPDAGSAFVVHPYIKDLDRATSRFWTPATTALVTLDGAAKAADSFATRENLDRGGMEYNPLARPFVHTPRAQVTAMAALFGAEIVAAYLLHKRHHDNLGRAVLVGGAAINGLGAAASFGQR